MKTFFASTTFYILFLWTIAVLGIWAALSELMFSFQIILTLSVIGTLLSCAIFYIELYRNSPKLNLKELDSFSISKLPRSLILVMVIISWFQTDINKIAIILMAGVYSLGQAVAISTIRFIFNKKIENIS